MNNLFLELLQVTLGTRITLSKTPSENEWKSIFYESQRQAIVGVMACGLEHLPKAQQPPQELLLQWIGITIQIERRNIITTKACREIVEQFKKDNFKTCVLKGQANHRYYPREMQNRRNCGDVDVWTLPKDGRRKKEDVRRVLEYIKRNYELTGLCWMHCNFNHRSGIPVEVHFHPSFINEPIRNRRFLMHFQDIGQLSCNCCVEGVELPVMRMDEDVIFQMNHIFRHLIDEGVGLRQIIDYYWLLIAWNKQHSRSKEEAMRIVSYLGMKRFAGALMYVLREVCKMPEDLLLCPASVEDGQLLLNEIMMAGNFGQSDPRMGKLAFQSILIRQLSQAWRRFKRNLRFLTSYPEEVIWEPFTRMYHFAWKKGMLW